MCGDLDRAKILGRPGRVDECTSTMAALTADLARDAFMSRDYQLACELFEQVIRECCREEVTESVTVASGGESSQRSQRLSLYYGYGDSLSRVGRLKEALDVFAHISGVLESGLIPLDRLRHLTSSLVETVLATRHNLPPASSSSSSVDPLCCPICEDILRFPVTATCGHTFCRQCCFGHSSCTVCHTRFPTLGSPTPGTSSTATITLLSLPATATVTSSASTRDHDKLAPDIAVSEELVTAGTSSSGSNSSGGRRESVIGFEQDILIRRLVERWWGPELKAAELNEEAQRHLDGGEGAALDEALRCCNQSLENAPTSHKGLLLRSEVLYRLQHYQSALADADSALKSRPTSHKAYHLRALSLSALGKPDQAITAHCIALFLDKQSMCVANGIKQDIAKDLQQLIATAAATRQELPLAIRDPLALFFGTPYSLMSSRKRRHHRILSAHKHKAKKQFLSLRTGDFDDCGGDHSDCCCGEDEEDRYLRAASLLDEMDDEEGFLRSAMMNPIHHRRKSLQLSFFSTQRSPKEGGGKHSTIIPRPNSRLRSFVDRMTQELEVVRWTAETAPVRLTASPLAIEASDFDCVLCCRTLFRPVVTPCGHTYCWVCLDRCMDYSSSCPLCMAPLIEQFRHHRTTNGPSLLATAAATNPTLISLSKRKVTRFVEEAMQRFIPDAYEKRQRQELDREPTVPVFICTTAFPSVPCPLFVYEPRYKLMVRRAIESGERQFGIALPQNGGRQRYVEYGTMLDIRDCVQLGDGCSILSTVGGRRFRVIARHEQDGYDTANVEFIEDENEAGTDEGLVRKLHEKVLLKAIGWHANLQERKKCEIAKSFGRMPALEENWENLVDGPAWAWWIIAILPLSEQLKVNILSTTSLEKRLRAIDKTLNLAPQKQKRPICVVPSSPASPGPPIGCCEGHPTPQQQQQHHLQNPTHQHHHDHQQQCQAIDCCLRERTTSADSDHHHHHHHHHRHHHHDSDRNSSGDHPIHLSQSAEAADYLL